MNNNKEKILEIVSLLENIKCPKMIRNSCGIGLQLKSKYVLQSDVLDIISKLKEIAKEI